MRNHYSIDPIDLSRLRTIPLAARGGKVKIDHFAEPIDDDAGLQKFVASLPHLLAGESFRSILDAISKARDTKRPIIWGLGGHVIKCGLGKIFVDLMDRGLATAFAMNGATSIHDFEIGVAGTTSEDVGEVLPGGNFGVAEETGREWNGALKEGKGLGEALGERLHTLAHPAYASASILLQAWRKHIPVTVHVAIGTDTTHIHPSANGCLLGAATYLDFKLLCGVVTQLNDGGVYINAGSAVILPEVFLKAVSAVRNLGYPLLNFTTINLDFINHYRPRTNVVERPHLKAGGKGYFLIGHHEIMIPLLAACLK